MGAKRQNHRLGLGESRLVPFFQPGRPIAVWDALPLAGLAQRERVGAAYTAPTLFGLF